MNRKEILEKAEKYMKEQEFKSTYLINDESLNYITFYKYGRRLDKRVILYCEIKINERSEVLFQIQYITKSMLTLSTGWYSSLFDEDHFNKFVDKIASSAMMLQLGAIKQ